MKLHFASRSTRHDVQARLIGDELEFAREGEAPRRYRFALSEDHIELQCGDLRWRAAIARAGHEIYLHLNGLSWHLHQVDAQEQEDLAATAADPVLRAPMPGRVLEVLCAAGAQVEAGTPLLRVEAMKMEVDLVAPLAGRVAILHVAAGQLVEPEQLLVTLEPHAS